MGNRNQKRITANMLKGINLMVYTNKSYIEIADELGINNNTITQWMKNELFCEELEKEVRRKYRGLAVKATCKLESLINSESDAVALNAVKEVLSKAGYDAVIKTENKNVDTIITVSIDDDNE